MSQILSIMTWIASYEPAGFLCLVMARTPPSGCTLFSEKHAKNVSATPAQALILRGKYEGNVGVDVAMVV